MIYDVYFGKPWPAPAFKGAELIATPVGAVCLYCGDLIDEDDDGTQMACLDADGRSSLKPVHLECVLRSMVGSVAHLQHRCSCYGEPRITEEEENMTYRQQAIAVREWVERRSGI